MCQGGPQPRQDAKVAGTPIVTIDEGNHITCQLLATMFGTVHATAPQQTHIQSACGTQGEVSHNQMQSEEQTQRDLALS